MCLTPLGMETVKVTDNRTKVYSKKSYILEISAFKTWLAPSYDTYQTAMQANKLPRLARPVWAASIETFLKVMPVWQNTVIR